MYDLIIVGGGAAALSSALYALGKDLNFVMVYEGLGGKAGWRQNLVGQMETEYLAGEEAVRLFERKVAAQAGRTMRDRVRDITKESGVFRIETEHHGVLKSQAVIVATGASPVKLDVPGAAELMGQGLGYSVTTHAHLLAGKTCVVVGTSIRALRGVAELARTATHVYLIIPDASSMSAPMARSLRHRPNVEVLAGYKVAEVCGAFNVEEIVVEHAGQTRRIAVEAAFVDLGLLPNSAIVRRIAQTDPAGFIWVDDHNATTLPGLFAAGDVTTAFGEQVLIAVGDGARAALSAYDYLLSLNNSQDAEGAD